MESVVKQPKSQEAQVCRRGMRCKLPQCIQRLLTSISPILLRDGNLGVRKLLFRHCNAGAAGKCIDLFACVHIDTAAAYYVENFLQYYDNLQLLNKLP